MTTKEQEKKALAQIRKIVESLGEDSYVKAAFEGCFEIAEENIENDSAISMKQKLERAEMEAEEEREIYESSTAMLNAALEEKNALVQTLEKKNNILSEAFQFLESNTLSREELLRVGYYIGIMKSESKSNREKQAERIIEKADSPNSVDFLDAVQRNREYRKMYEECEKLEQRIMDIYNTRK